MLAKILVLKMSVHILLHFSQLPDASDHAITCKMGGKYNMKTCKWVNKLKQTITTLIHS